MTRQTNRHLKIIVGENIRAARGEMTQRQVANLLDIDPMSVSRWERGKVLPSTESLIAIADALGRDLGWFYVDHQKAAA